VICDSLVTLSHSPLPVPESPDTTQIQALLSYTSGHVVVVKLRNNPRRRKRPTHQLIEQYLVFLQEQCSPGTAEPDFNSGFPPNPDPDGHHWYVAVL
jgi:hypothetical protein